MAITVPRVGNIGGGAGVNRASCTTSTTAAASAGNCKLAITAAFRGEPTADLVDSYDFTTGAGTVNIASPALRVAFVDGSYWKTEISFWLQPNAPAGITTGKPVLASDTPDNNVRHVICEIADVLTVSVLDKTASQTSAGNAGVTSITATTATLAQAKEIVFFVFADRWNYITNGDSVTGDVPAGSGFTLLAGDATNGVLSFTCGYKVVDATTAISLTSTFADQVDQGQVFGIITLKGVAGNLRVKVTGFDPAVVAPGGTPIVADDAGVWTGNPYTTLCNQHYEDVPFNVDGSMYLAPAPAGTVDTQTVNVHISDATTSSAGTGFLPGVVEAYTP